MGEIAVASVLSKTWKVQNDTYHMPTEIPCLLCEDIGWVLENKQVVTLITSALTNMLSFLDQINTGPGTWNPAVNLSNTFYSRSVCKDRQKQFAFVWNSQQLFTHRQYFTLLSQGYANSVFWNVVCREIDCCYLVWNITLVLYIIFWWFDPMSRNLGFLVG